MYLAMFNLKFFCHQLQNIFIMQIKSGLKIMNIHLIKNGILSKCTSMQNFFAKSSDATFMRQGL